jgi:hypothetical protein
LSAGAFSDTAVIEASKKLVCVFVDCDWGKKNNDLSDKFKVRGYPTVAFCDPEGNQVASLGSRDPSAVAAQIAEVVKKYGKVGFETFEKAAEVAKEEKKPVLYVFVKPAVASSLAAAVADESLKELVGKFVVAQSEITKENADAKAFSISESTLLVLDPNAEASKSKPLLKLTGKKDLKEVRKQLEATLKKFEEGSAEK